MNNRGFGLTEMLIIMGTLILCLVVVVITYNTSFKNDNVDIEDKQTSFESINKQENIDNIKDYNINKETKEQQEKIEKEEKLTKKEQKYKSIEEKLVNTAKLYIDNNYDLKNEEVTISIKKLIEENYISVIKDPMESDKECSGYITYDGSTYKAYLKCGDNYQTGNYKSEFE